MNKKWMIIIILSSIILLLIGFKKPIQKLMTRGYKNKNPGNIRKTKTMWTGEVKGTDPDFKTFSSMEIGRAHV